MVTSDLGTHTSLSTFPQLHSFLRPSSQPSASSLSLGPLLEGLWP